MYTKLRCLKSFNNGLFTNQVPNVLTEVVKSGHICIQNCLLRCFSSGPILQIRSQIFAISCFLLQIKWYIMSEHIPNNRKI